MLYKNLLIHVLGEVIFIVILDSYLPDYDNKLKMKRIGSI